MGLKQSGRLYGIESGKGSFNDTSYDSTKAHLAVDLGEKSTGKTMGVVTRPFKLGDSTQIDRWEVFKSHLALGRGIPVMCEFEVIAASTGVKLELISMEPDAEAIKKEFSPKA